MAAARDELPVDGSLSVEAAGGAVSIALDYHARGVIRLLRVSLAGPGIDVVLNEMTPGRAHVAWSGGRDGLADGAYTVSVDVEVAGPDGVRSGTEARTVVLDAVGPEQPDDAPTLDDPDAAPDGPPLETRRTEPTAAGGGVAAVGETIAADVVVYGATPSGILAAVSAGRRGADVALVEPLPIVGGMITNGLNVTDYGHPATIGGYTDEFFDRVQAIEGSAYGRWRFQPSTGLQVFTQMLAESGVAVYLGEALLESGGVLMDGTEISAIITTADREFVAPVYIDASYEGDLMAQAGVSHRIGREGVAEYGESFAGVRGTTSVFPVDAAIDPYFPVAAPGPVGSGDDRTQNSNFRLCFSRAPTRVPFAAPSDYDAARYDIVADYLDWRVRRGETPDITWFLWPVLLTNQKYDVNNNGTVSIGMYNLASDYAEMAYSERAETEAWLQAYTQGFLYFLANDERVPQRIRGQMATYGLCHDEWADNDNWPHRFYLREARRMVGRYVLTERDVLLNRTKSDTVTIASYAFDSHHISRWIDGNNRLAVEGGFWNGRAAATRWSVPYRSLTPQANEATNLLVSVAVSASHVALSSLRMEPQYMLMGEAAGVAADLAMRASTPVQSVSPVALRDALRRQGAVIDNYLFWDAIHSPYRGDIENTHLRGVTFGCTPVTFCGGSNLPRDVMAAFLSNVLDLPPASRDYFTDDSASPHEDAINRVAQARITRGCDTTLFCPTDTVNRGQMSAFLNRTFRLAPTTRDFFTDDEKSIYEGDINRLAASGITAGCGRTKFCPKNLVLREQIAAFLWRAIR
jgi:hypothetical protein